MMKTRAAAALALAVALLSGCAKGTVDPATGVTTAPGPTTPGTSATQTIEEAPASLVDGRHPVFLTKIDVAAKTVTFDLVVFLTGAEATAAAKKDHPGTDADDFALNGYYIVNNNPLLRTLPIAPGVTVREVNLSTPLPDLLQPTTLAQLSTEDTKGRPFWLTVDKGQITKIEEQFIP